MNTTEHRFNFASNIPKPKPFIPSPQQQAMADWVIAGSGSCNLIARAGTGKTTTLIWLLQYMEGDVFLGAFNKSIADEITAKVALIPNLRCRVRSSTMHSAGFNAWKFANTGKRIEVKQYKVRDIIDELAENNEVYTRYAVFLSKLVSFAKQAGFGVKGMPAIEDTSAWDELVDYYSLDDDIPDGGTLDTGTLIGVAQGIYRKSLDLCRKVVDFDDMLLAPLYFGAKFYPQDWVLIDEAQDTNAVRREIALRMLKRGGRLIAVGDPCQAIYGFTGADADAMDLIQERLGSVVMPLTVTYRCPKVVVKLAQSWVEDIQAHEGNADGTHRTVELVPTDGFKENPNWFWNCGPFTADDAILCRNTKPLVEMAYSFLRQQIPCRIEGRDIGANLIRLASKWKVVTLDALCDRLETYRQNETRKLLAKKRESKAAEVEDKIDTMMVLIDACRERGKDKVQDLIDSINALFGDTPAGEQPRCITLSTIHKAKGREWPRVFILGRNRYMPSKWARKPWELRQEQNLMYTAVTRSKGELIDVHVPIEQKKRRT